MNIFMLRGVTHFFRRVSSVPKLAPSKPFHCPQSFSTQCSSVSRLLFATLPTPNPRNSHGMSSRQGPVSAANGEIQSLATPSRSTQGQEFIIKGEGARTLLPETDSQQIFKPANNEVTWY